MTKQRLVLLSTDPAATELIARLAADCDIEVVSDRTTVTEHYRENADAVIIGSGTPSPWEVLDLSRDLSPICLAPEQEWYYDDSYRYYEANLPEPIDQIRSLVRHETINERTNNRLAAKWTRGSPPPVKGIGKAQRGFPLASRRLAIREKGFSEATWIGL